jgi:hypothetical protein
MSLPGNGAQNEALSQLLFLCMAQEALDHARGLARSIQSRVCHDLLMTAPELTLGSAAAEGMFAEMREAFDKNRETLERSQKMLREINAMLAQTQQAMLRSAGVLLRPEVAERNDCPADP